MCHAPFGALNHGRGLQHTREFALLDEQGVSNSLLVTLVASMGGETSTLVMRCRRDTVSPVALYPLQSCARVKLQVMSAVCGEGHEWRILVNDRRAVQAA